MSRGPSIISAACRLIVDHGPQAAKEAEKRAEDMVRSKDRRIAMLWDQVAIAIRTIEHEASEPGQRFDFPTIGLRDLSMVSAGRG